MPRFALLFAALVCTAAPLAAATEKSLNVKGAGPSGEHGVVARAEADEIQYFDGDSPAMTAAYARARATLDDFLALWREPPPGAEYFSVKVPISDENGTEHFWIALEGMDGERFRGTIDNMPRIVRSVAAGESITFSREQIVDWTYGIDGRIEGNFTACGMIEQESAEEREHFMATYGLSCE